MQEILIRLIADGAVVPVVLIGAWALLFKLKPGSRYQAYCRVLLAGLTAYMLAKFAGAIYQPELQRPFELMGVDAGASFLNNPGFPSDHALFCAAITLAIWFESRQRSLAIAATVLTLLVCVGRVLALVHSPLDVIGGVTIALLGAVWYVQRAPLGDARRVKQWSKPAKAGKIS